MRAEGARRGARSESWAAQVWLLGCALLALGADLGCRKAPSLVAPAQAKSARARGAQRPPHGAASAAPLPADSAFHSLESCRAALLAGRRMARPSGVARIGSWNLHWFPEGRPGFGSSGESADLDWLACAIAFMDVDVLAMQEVKTHARARRALLELEKELDRLTHGSWQSRLDDCPLPAAQHVGFLFDARRVRVRQVETLAELNPRGAACADQLRPGLGAYLTFPGGLDLELVTLHLKSGSERRALELRRVSAQAFGRVLEAARRSFSDDDALFIGDFNAMGCAHCSPKVSPAEERQALAALLEHSTPALVLAPADLSCSEYHRGSGTLLDLAAWSRGMAEVPAGTELTVSGPCRDTHCSRVERDEQGALARLSDHCPVFIDLRDRDLD